MKFSLKLPSGATVDFEGDADEFALVSGFLEEPPESLLAEESSAEDAFEDNEYDEPENEEPVASLNARVVAQRFEEVGAQTEMDRVTVIAQLAVEAGYDGADYNLVDQLYTEMGMRKPPRFTKSVANAKSAGLVRTAGYGRWKPTVKGENFARGLGRERASRRAQRPQDRSSSGGEDD